MVDWILGMQIFVHPCTCLSNSSLLFKQFFLLSVYDKDTNYVNSHSLFCLRSFLCTFRLHFQIWQGSRIQNVFSFYKIDVYTLGGLCVYFGWDWQRKSSPWTRPRDHTQQHEGREYHNQRTISRFQFHNSTRLLHSKAEDRYIMFSFIVEGWVCTLKCVFNNRYYFSYFVAKQHIIDMYL